MAGVGTAIHGWFSGADDSHAVIKERRLEMPVPTDGVDLTLSGQPDLIETDQPVTYTDYKLKKSIYRPGLPDPGQKLQVNLYAYLIKEVLDLTVERAQLWFCAVRPIDRKGTDDQGQPFKYQVVDTYVAPVPLLPRSEVEREIERLAREQAQVINTGVLPPAFKPGDPKFYLCGFCPVVEACARRALHEE
jgi:hypothetical protein